MNKELLAKAIEESGYKVVHIIEEVGLSRQAWYNKINDRTQFTSTEISMLKRILKLSPEQVDEIFLG